MNALHFELQHSRSVYASIPSFQTGSTDNALNLMQVNMHSRGVHCTSLPWKCSTQLVTVRSYPSGVLVIKSGMPGALAAGGSKAPRGLPGKEDVGNIANAPHVLSTSINVPASVPAHKLWAAELICAAKVCWAVPLQPWNRISAVRGALE